LALLTLEGVTISYGLVTAVHHLDLEVGAGEVVCLLGSNGAGKTSVLSAISGIVRPKVGTIRFNGERIDGGKPEHIASLGIGHLPEGRGIFGTLTVRENLDMGAYGAGLAKEKSAEEIEKALVVFPRLRARLNQEAGTLSGGEQQMLGLARALIAEPKLLMIDELSFGLAPAVVEQLFTYVGEVARAGTAVLLVEQFVGEALSIASRAYVLEKGKAVFAGPAQTLRSDSGFIEEFYLGHAAGQVQGSNGSRAGEEVRVAISGRLWRDVEVIARREGRLPEDYVAAALGRLVVDRRDGGGDVSDQAGLSDRDGSRRRGVRPKRGRGGHGHV